MGGGGGYSDAYYEARAREAQAEDDTFAASAAKFDCKDYAIEYAAKNDDLSVNRGYILLPEGFTEHWWCVKERKGTSHVIDLTGFCGIGGIYLPLKEQAPQIYSKCDALDGPCQDGHCPWCVMRFELEAKGKPRLLIKQPQTYRFLFDRLMLENTSLRTQLTKEKNKTKSIESDRDEVMRKLSPYVEAERRRRGGY
jgi:hypothetical protein